MKQMKKSLNHDLPDLYDSYDSRNQGSDNMQGWEIKKLSEICEFSNGLWTGKKPPFQNVGVIRNTNFTKDGKLDDSDIVYLDVEQSLFAKRNLQYGDIILEKSGGGPKQPVGRVIIFDKKKGDFSFSNFTSVIRIVNPKDVDFTYLHRFLFFSYVSGVTETMQSHSTGIRNLKFDDYKAIEIPLPPLPEQQRIVTILDEAFAAIAEAKANAEQNLKNAKELFESYLQGIMSEPRLTRLKDSQDFKNQGNQANQKNQGSDKGDGWEVKKLGEIVDIINGRNQSQVISENGKFPIYGSAANLMGYATDYLCEKGTTIIGRKGNISNPIYVEERFWNVDTAFGLFPKNGYDTKFIYYLCRTIDFKSRNRGTTIPSLVKSDLLSIDVPFISSIKEQQTIVHQLDALRAETQKLEAVYQKKLDDLEELKKSVLKRAFAGEL